MAALWLRGSHLPVHGELVEARLPQAPRPGRLLPVTAGAGLSFPVAATCGVAVATVLGFLAGASALRVRGVSLAVVTLAAAIGIEQFGFANGTWRMGPWGSPVPEPTILGVDVGAGAGVQALHGDLPSPALGFVVMAVAALCCLLVAGIRSSGLGVGMLAVRANERAAAAAGVSVRDTT